MILHAIKTKAVAALQSEKISLFEGVKADIAQGATLCHWNYSDVRFDFCRRNVYPYRAIKTIIIIKPMIIIRPIIIILTSLKQLPHQFPFLLLKSIKIIIKILTVSSTSIQNRPDKFERITKGISILIIIDEIGNLNSS